jgi:hypothetical protein
MKKSIEMRLQTLAGLVLNPCGNPDRSVQHNAALRGVRPEALLIALSSPARPTAHGIIFAFQAHVIAAGERPAESSRISHGSEPWPGLLRG